MLYRFEVQQLIKFEVYDIDTRLHDLKFQDFLGSCESTLGHVKYLLFISLNIAPKISNILFFL